MTQFDKDSERLFKEAQATNSAIGVEPRNFNQAESIFRSLISQNNFNPSHTQTGNSTSRPAFSLTAYKSNIDNIATELGRQGKALEFIVSQAALALLNPTFGQGQILNPLALVLGPLPFLGGLTTPFLDVPLASMNPVTDSNKDNIKELYKGNKVETKIEAGIPPFSISPPKTRVPSEKSEADVSLEKKYNELNLANKDRPMDLYTSLDPFQSNNTMQQFVATNPGKEVAVSRPDYSAIFSKHSRGPDFGSSGKGFGGNESQAGQNKVAIFPYGEDYARYERKQENFDSFYDSDDLNNGYLNSPLNNFDFANEQVVPFFLTDLRKPERFVAFRAFLESFSETISPNWNEEEFMGRVDQVATYKSTTRSFSVSFKIAAMSQEGVIAMWNKINNLCKMAYPTYRNGLIDKSPVVRMRIGDVCADERGNGLPGRLGEISFNFDESTWEIEDKLRLSDGSNVPWGFVPQWGVISFTFTVIHEDNPSNDINYNFNFKNFRRAGKK